LSNDSIYSDQGRHHVGMAIGRFEARCPREQHPAALADSLFTEPIPYRGEPCRTALQALHGGESLIPCWAKPIGTDDWVLRLHEVGGERGTAQLSLASGWSARPVDLLDQPVGPPLDNGRIRFRPYEILGLRISRASP
jgi:alpha-mannosidase